VTPAINVAKRAKIQFDILSYEHDPDAKAYGLEAAQKLALDPEYVFKTLVAQCDKDLVVAIIPVATQLNLKALAAHQQCKKAALAEPQQVISKTGYIMGGVSPLGQKNKLTTIIDQNAEKLPYIYVSAGKRGLEIKLSPTDLKHLTNAQFAAITRP
jgi:Cys-tRNA(Pro)/Cys-tRNA(Cys) deacylase